MNDIAKSYDKNAMLIGEAPATKDLIEVTDNDFKTVSAVSIVLIFLIITVVLRSVSLPVILVAVIESAIFINMGNTGLYRDEASVYSFNCYRYYSAWSDCRLCNSYDDQV